jgi:RNase P protein component
VDNAVVRDIIKRLDSYKEAFAHVARQLEAGGYDTATIANRMSGKAVAEFAEADKLMKQLDEVLRNEVTEIGREPGPCLTRPSGCLRWRC